LSPAPSKKDHHQKDKYLNFSTIESSLFHGNRAIVKAFLNLSMGCWIEKQTIAPKHFLAFFL